jgi:rhamnosyl/mannosyltransferase
MNRIKVLHIGKYYYPYFGGTESHLHTLANELKEAVDIKILVSNTIFKTSIKRDSGIYIYRLASLGSLFSLPLTFSLPFWLKRLDCDILHFHLPNPLAVISFFLARPSGKVIVSYHSDIIRQRFFSLLFNTILIKFLKKTEVIIVTSKNLIDNSPILTRFKNKCKIIPHGIDLNKFVLTPKVTKESEEIKQKFSSPIILFVGRLVYYKGLEYLIKAMKKIEASLLVIGDGPLEKRLKNMAYNWGISNKIIWVGKIDNEKLVPYYYACDIFVLPSAIKAESFGLVQLEAFACGKPVISTNLPTGVPYVNLHGKTGLVVVPKDSEVIARAVNILLASKELRKHYGQNGRERLEYAFTKEIMSKEVLSIYSSLFNY